MATQTSKTDKVLKLVRKVGVLRRRGRCTMDDLWHYADICRVRNVMRPYLESLAA
jgi:hypothetical protein